MENNRSGQDEMTDTTHTDSIETLLDDVFGFSPVEDDSNEPLQQVARSKQSRLSGEAEPDKRRTRNVTKQTASNTSTGKVGKKVKVNNVVQTAASTHVKCSTSKMAVLVNPTKTVDNVSRLTEVNPADVKGQANTADESVTAMLDDIFFGDGGTPTKTRKPPKHKSPRRVRRICRSSDSTESDSATVRGFGKNGTDRTSAAKSSMKCDSELNDIFSDTQKWVQKDKPHRYGVEETADNACTDDDDIYDKLLATGKLQRIKR